MSRPQAAGLFQLASWAVLGVFAGLAALAGPRPAAAVGPAAAAARTSLPPDFLAPVVINRNSVDIEFPERLTFNLALREAEAVSAVVLEYGVGQLTCATVTAKAFPLYEPGTETEVSWTWEMLQSGSEPPGAQIWWQWRLLGADGAERLTERQTAIWLDDEHDWETIDEQGVALHWYRGGRSFASTLHTTALRALEDLAVTPGLTTEAPVHLYIYGDSQALQEAVLYEPGWTGGLAYAEHSIVLIGIEPDNLEWGQRTVAHELAHVLVGHYTFSCLGYVPTWLNEGLAVYAEGGPEPHWTAQLEAAIADDTLIPLEALNGGFSEDPAQADLSYVQSYSVVNYLIDTHGAEAMLALLARLRDGEAVEAALSATYGFGLAALEQDWRAAIGAEPVTAAQVTATPALTPTPVPTIVPLDGIPVGPTVAPTRERPLPTAITPPRPDLAPSAQRAGLAAGALLACCLALCGAGGVLGLGAVAAVWLGRRR